MLSICSRATTKFSSKTIDLLKCSFPFYNARTNGVRLVRSKQLLPNNYNPHLFHSYAKLANKEDDEEKVDDIYSDLMIDHELRRRTATWNTFTQYAKSAKGEQGIKRVWETFQSFPIEEVPELYETELWNHVSGPEVVDYMAKLNDAGITPPTGTLHKIGLEHHSLKWLSFTREELVDAALKYSDVELPEDTYSILMPKLCQTGDHHRALHWHRKLVSKGDPPRSKEDIAALRSLLLDKQDWSAALEVKRDIKEIRGVAEPVRVIQHNPDPTPSLDEEERDIAIQSFVNKMDEKMGVSSANASMDDHRCARFLATTFFSVEFVMEGLSLFGVTKIGPLAVREMMRRTIRGQHCETSLARQYFAKMKQLGFDYSTRYGRLLEHIANLEKDIILYSIVSSYEDPELFNDYEYQEQTLQTTNPVMIERARLVLSFEMHQKEVEVRNILIRVGLEDIEKALADGIPILQATRTALTEACWIPRPPWLSKHKLRALARLFARIPTVSAYEWAELIRVFTYLTDQGLRKDMEALLLSLKDPKVFDFKTIASVIRWYMRLGAEAKTMEIETMLGGVKVLAALRDIGLVDDIHYPCEAILFSVFGGTPISLIRDRKRRDVAASLGTFEDYVIAIRSIYDPNMWPGMTPTDVKETCLAVGTAMKEDRAKRFEGSEPLSAHDGSWHPGKEYFLQKQVEAEEEEQRFKKNRS